MVRQFNDEVEFEEFKNELNVKISFLRMRERIRLLEFISGVREIKEVKPEEVCLVRDSLIARIHGYIPNELIPDKWHLPKDDSLKFGM